MIKSIYKYFKYYGTRQKMKKHGHELWWKFKWDHWPNLITMSDGSWFLADEIDHVEKWGGQVWIQFSSENYGEFSGMKDEKNDIRKLGYRRFVVNASNIVSAMEYDS